LKDGQRLDVAPFPDRFQYITHGSLRIRRATSLDEGYYQCAASNDVGTALSSVVRLRRSTTPLSTMVGGLAYWLAAFVA